MLTEGLLSKSGGGIAASEERLALGERVFGVDLAQVEPAAEGGGGHDRYPGDIVLGGVRQGMELQRAARVADVEAIELSHVQVRTQAEGRVGTLDERESADPGVVDRAQAEGVFGPVLHRARYHDSWRAS